MYRGTQPFSVNPVGRAAFAGVGGVPALARLVGAGSSDLAQVQPLLWTMIAISAAGSIVTFAVLVYALAKFRDPATRRRRYG